MRIKSLIGSCLAMLALSGCGGGGSTPATSQTTTPAAGATVLSGLASKGPIKTGTVKVFAIRNGAVDTTAPIGQGVTDATGNFTVDCGTFKGPVMVEATGGTFTDEVSGATVSLKSPLQAVVADATTGTKTVAVTPLTHLASKRAQSHPAVTPDIINESNASVATTFNLPDIVSTLPVAGGGSDSQKKYAAACGSFSQLANNRSKSSGQSLDDALQSVMTELENETEHSGGLSDSSINSIMTAETEFNSGGKNQSGADAPTIAPTNGTLKISTSGPANTIGAVDLTVALPAGATVAADPVTGEAAAGTVTISGAAASGGNKLIAAKVTPASNAGPGKVTISMISATGFAPGECVTVDFAMTAGATFPAKDAFAVTGASVKGLDGKPLTGMTAAPASLAAL